MAVSDIVLTETAGSPVVISFSSNERVILFSTTITINMYDDNHMDLIRKINSFDPADPHIVNSNVKFITIVTVTDIGTYLPTVLRYLKSLDKDKEEDQGVVVTVRDRSLMEFVHKPKRTTGKVSNSLG